ncbi:MAG: zeta toxin family protein [Bacteroidales bacterium]|nr:zeta toxin family protein [Bacteroidales bacterium]
MQNLYIIAGCNGAGKTTASFTVLPEMLNCDEFVNADEIARGLSPLNPEKSAIEAGRWMLKKIDQLISSKTDFAFETTLASRSYKKTIIKAKEAGYQITLLFFWLESVELAIERVKIRVEEGGHNIPKDIIRRRYYAGLKNLFEIYIPVCDYWMLFDNSKLQSELIAEGYLKGEIEVKNNRTFDLIKSKI